MWSHHSLNTNFHVVCGISGCKSKFTGERSFLRHVKSKHNAFHCNYMKEIVVGCTNRPTVELGSQDDHDVDVNDDSGQAVVIVVILI